LPARREILCEGSPHWTYLIPSMKRLSVHAVQRCSFPKTVTYCHC